MQSEEERRMNIKRMDEQMNIRFGRATKHKSEHKRILKSRSVSHSLSNMIPCAEFTESCVGQGLLCSGSFSLFSIASSPSMEHFT
jgi:hypothetical protein